MSWAPGIHVESYDPHRPSETLSLLRQAGWGFGDIILYEHYLGDFDCDFLEAPAASWEGLLKLLDEKAAAGEGIQLRFTWPEPFVFITCNQQGPLTLAIYPDASAPLISGSRAILDYSWLLQRTVVPLEQAGWNLSNIDCGQFQ